MSPGSGYVGYPDGAVRNYYLDKLASKPDNVLEGYATQWENASKFGRFILSLNPFVNYRIRSETSREILSQK